jgi:hypothetical protein
MLPRERALNPLHLANDRLPRVTAANQLLADLFQPEWTESGRQRVAVELYEGFTGGRSAARMHATSEVGTPSFSCKKWRARGTGDRLVNGARRSIHTLATQSFIDECVVLRMRLRRGVDPEVMVPAVDPYAGLSSGTMSV